jgi:hypothetical protein
MDWVGRSVNVTINHAKKPTGAGMYAQFSFDAV